MNDAVQQDFFFLNFFQQALVNEKAIARGLQDAGLFREGRRAALNGQNALARYEQLFDDRAAKLAVSSGHDDHDIPLQYRR